MTKRERKNARRIAARNALPYIIIPPMSDRAALQALRDAGILQ